MKKKNAIVVMGLGVFGSSVAKTLSEYDCDVLAIDREMENVERVSDFVNQAIQADFTDCEQLEELGLENYDIALIASGRNLESSILGVLNAKKLGVSTVVAKAKNKTYMDILLRIGADRVVRPEKETGVRIARELIQPDLLDIVELDKVYNIYEIKAPVKWLNKDLETLDLRNVYGINIIGFKNSEGNLAINFNPKTVIKENDIIVLIGDGSFFKKLEAL